MLNKTPKKTPLFEQHKRLGAKFTEFAGWELPLYYSGIIDEHMAVRQSAGVFDVTHLGKIMVKGNASFEFLQYLATCDVSGIPVGCGAYTMFCDEQGGILDDDIIYRLGEREYLIICNAARVGPLFYWFRAHGKEQLEITDVTDEYCMLALQGPRSVKLLKEVFDEEPSGFKRYTVRVASVDGKRYSIMRSGYTGEKGYEILCDRELAGQAWNELIERDCKPAGLGARDTLRLEMGYALYGKDITQENTPAEAGLMRFVAVDKGDFIGRKAIIRQINEGVTKRMFGFVTERGIARGGESILVDMSREIGKVTSGGYSPVKRSGIGLAYVDYRYASTGTDIEIETGDKVLKARLENPPFIKPSNN